jgi:hypothetical protein
MRGQRHASAAFYPQERPGTHCTGGWVDPRAGLDRCRKSRPPPGFDPRTVQPVASRYTDWATRPFSKVCILYILGDWRLVAFGKQRRPHSEYPVTRSTSETELSLFSLKYSDFVAFTAETCGNHGTWQGYQVSALNSRLVIEHGTDALPFKWAIPAVLHTIINIGGVSQTQLWIYYC